MFEFLAVLWRPRSIFASLNLVSVRRLAGKFLLLELLVSVVGYSAYADKVSQAALLDNHITAAAQPVVVILAIIVSTLFSSVLIVLAAAVLLVCLFIAASRSRYRDIVGILYFAAVPSLLGRAVRNVFYGVGDFKEISEAALTLDKLVPLSIPAGWNRILSVIDVFDLWTFSLVIIGFSTIAGLRGMRAHAMSSFVWGLFFIFQVRIHLMTSGVS